MSTMLHSQGRQGDRERRDDRREEDTGAWRPNDEVPANRREDSRRHDRDEEQEKKVRRGS